MPYGNATQANGPKRPIFRLPHSAYSDSVQWRPLANAGKVFAAVLTERRRKKFRIELWPTFQFYGTVLRGTLRYRREQKCRQRGSLSMVSIIIMKIIHTDLHWQGTKKQPMPNLRTIRDAKFQKGSTSLFYKTSSSDTEFKEVQMLTAKARKSITAHKGTKEVRGINSKKATILPGPKNPLFVSMRTSCCELRTSCSGRKDKRILWFFRTLTWTLPRFGVA